MYWGCRNDEIVGFGGGKFCQPNSVRILTLNEQASTHALQANVKMNRKHERERVPLSRNRCNKCIDYLEKSPSEVQSLDSRILDRDSIQGLIIQVDSHLTHACHIVYRHCALPLPSSSSQHILHRSGFGRLTCRNTSRPIINGERLMGVP